MRTSLKYYLATYNLVAFLAWLAYLLDFIASGFSISPSGLLMLNIAQGMALLEIAHTILRWVKSPVLSTAAQVASRLLVLVLINVFLVQGPMRPVTGHGILIVSFAWSITELVRYSFYCLQLFGLQPRWLLWMRYSFFILLYPTGVTGEWLIILTPVVAHHLRLDPYFAFAIILALSYIYYFPVLYGYMWKQRKAKLGA